MGEKVIGIDLGATNIRAAVFENDRLGKIVSASTPSQGPVEEVLDVLYGLINAVMEPSVVAIGVGVPSVVDVEAGIVYDVQHIPSWKEVPLKKWMESVYRLPVFVNNDANCFAVGEYYFGKGKAAGQGVNAMVGLTLGTGLGAGVVINNKLYNGHNCGAGEFGSVDYLDANLEYYASGAFFQHVHGQDGLKVFEAAQKNDQQALALYHEFGVHVGHALKTVMYTYDPELIVLGGSVSHAYPFFKESMLTEMRHFDYPKSLARIRIEVSELHNSGVLGAAALYYDAK